MHRRRDQPRKIASQRGGKGENRHVKAFDVTSEQGRRKEIFQVDLPRDCCVKAYGLSEPESGTQK